LVNEKYYRVVGLKSNSCNSDLTTRKSGGGIYVQAVSNMEDNRLRTTNINVNNYSGLSMTVYPQPASDKLNIALSSSVMSEVKIEILNIMGVTIADIYNGWHYAGASKLELDLRKYNIKSGVYFLSLTSIQGTVLKKLVIQ
jgi:hypothetical protein